jgi:carboxypeptidase T
LKHAVATDEEPRYIPSVSGYFNYKLKCMGMNVPATFTVSIIPVSAAITSVGAPKTYSNFSMLQEANDSISFTISPAPLQGQTIEYIIAVSNGSYTRKDTIEKVFGTPTILFSSNGNSMTGWTTSTGWGVDNNIFYSPSGSIADSPNGNYNSDDSTRVRTTTQMNLNGALSATLSFRARWEVEPRFDYVEVMASDDNGASYTPLCGKYTKAGNAYQDEGEPIYDGFMFPWVREEINLDGYINKNILIRFMLKADNGSEYDGFFFDDLKVEEILNTNGVDEMGGGLEFAVFPNPTSGKFQLAVGNLPSAMVRVTDMLGNIIKSSVVNQPSTIMDLSENPAGVYFIKVSDEKGNFGVKKVILE